MSGPPPKKDAERRRRNTNDGPSSIPAEIVNIDDLLVGEVEIPVMDDAWHPIAKHIYESQMASGQVIYMEPSDWAMLYLLCESISRDLNPQFVGLTPDVGTPIYESIPLKGASLNAYLKGFNELLVGEGGRRKLRLELERNKRIEAAGEGATVTDITKNRAEAFA